MLFIGMCTFIANDLDDTESDRINHAERPLPRGDVSPSIAATLYFICLGAALFTTRTYVPFRTAFGYYFLLCMSISYRYIVEVFPVIKAPYVATAFALPVIILASYYPSNRLRVAAVSVFMYTMGKELCMDLIDRPGDATSVLHRVPEKQLAITAFCVQALALFLLLVLWSGWLDSIFLITMTSAFAGATFCWFSARRQIAVQVMRIQFLLGLRFLL